MGVCCQCFKDQRDAITRERNVFPVIDPNPLKPDKFRYEAVFLIGKPGSGVSTQSKLLSEHGNWMHINVPDLLSSYVAEQSQKCDFVVYPDLIVNLIYTTIQNCGSGKFAIDGFPQSRENLQSWLNQVKDVRVRCVFVLLANDSVLSARDRRGGGKKGAPLKSETKEFEERVNPMLEMLSPYKVKVHRIEADGTRSEVQQRISFEIGRYQRLTKDVENNGQVETEVQEILFNLVR